MSESWADVFPDRDRPVLGDPTSYATAQARAAEVRRSTEACAAEFGRIRSADGSDQLQGQAALQLGTLVREVDDAFEAVPPVFDQLTAIFDQHEGRLRELRAAAASALARARTRWDTVQQAESDHARANSALRRIEEQTQGARLNALVDPLAAAELPAAERSERDARGAAGAAAAVLADARDALDSSRAEFDRLRQDEADLVEATARDIRNVDLGELKDPNRLFEIVGGALSWAGNLVADVVVGVYRAIEAALDGRFMDALWHLSDALGAALTILAVVAVVIAVVATGGLGLTLLAVGLAGLKLAADAMLAGTQHPHPETGQTRTWGEVAIDAVFLTATIATAGIVRGGPSAGARVGGAVTGTAASGPTASVISNIGTIVNPVGRSGTTLYGAARAATTNRATREVIAVAVDDLALGLGGIPLDAAVKAHVGGGITTDPAAWTNPTLVDLAESSPPATAAARRIETATNGIARFSSSGPQSRPEVPVFQLSRAE